MAMFPDYLTEFQRGLQGAKALADIEKKAEYTRDLSSLYKEPLSYSERLQASIPIMGIYDPASAISKEKELYALQLEAKKEHSKRVLDVVMPVIKAGLDAGDINFVSEYTKKVSEENPALAGIFADMSGMKINTTKGTAHISVNPNTGKPEWSIISPRGEVTYTGAKAVEKPEREYLTPEQNAWLQAKNAYLKTGFNVDPKKADEYADDVVAKLFKKGKQIQNTVPKATKGKQTVKEGTTKSGMKYKIR